MYLPSVHGDGRHYVVDLILKSDLKLKSEFDIKGVNLWDSAQRPLSRGINWKRTSGILDCIWI